MQLLLCLIFFVSGLASLLFETLWFRQAGLTFGNGVWASSIVLASFMTGLALGNGLAARFGERVRHPLLVYAFFESTIAVAGVALVMGLPLLTPWLTPLLGSVIEHGWLVNPLRLAIVFTLLLVPATAMGATLPIVAKALLHYDPNFGSVLGRLYGWNTLGAVFGALAGEALLIGWFGVRGSALVAAGLEAVAIGGAVWLSRHFLHTPTRLGRPGRLAGIASPHVEPARARAEDVRPKAIGVLLAALLSGFVLLALEVVWFRFLHLFVVGDGLAFSTMLAVVLAGIAVGGLAAAHWLSRDPRAARHAATVAYLAGFLVVVLYRGFAFFAQDFALQQATRTIEVLRLATVLTFPVALLSGILFTFIGTLLNELLGKPVRAAGLATLANTVGAGLGPLATGFLLLPWLGMERCFLVLATTYGAVALLLARLTPRDAVSASRHFRWVAPALFATALLLFPLGMMKDVYLELTVRRWDPEGEARVMVTREGVRETIVYLQREMLGERLGNQLLTDGISMSGTSIMARRYMKLYVQWPVALRPDPKRALLISYGVGSTAKALTDTQSLEHIDVVDISRDILELSEVVYPDPSENPLHDPRVSSHVEDGRYFLQASRERYDLITAEPPPPTAAGVVYLYTREYFQLIYDHLAEGGINTYWLPVPPLAMEGTLSVIRAYCDVFPDCSLWTGAGYNWMLVGSRGAQWTRNEEEFTRQWRDPAVSAELRATGLELPEQMAALFLADSRQLGELTADAQPLIDDFPKRLVKRDRNGASLHRLYGPWMDTRTARTRFEASSFVRDAWPPALRERSLDYFEYQRILNESTSARPPRAKPLHRRIAELDRVLSKTSLRTLPLFQQGVTPDQVRIAARHGVDEAAPELDRVLAAGALAERDFSLAAQHFARAQRAEPSDPSLDRHRIYALCMAGDIEQARAVARGAAPLTAQAERSYWAWMQWRFGLEAPAATNER